MKELSNVSRDENFKYQTCSTHEEKECLLDQLKTVYGQQSELENKHPDRNLKLEKQIEMNRKKQKLWENYKQMQSRDPQRKRKRNRNCLEQ